VGQWSAPPRAMLRPPLAVPNRLIPRVDSFDASLTRPVRLFGTSRRLRIEKSAPEEVSSPTGGCQIWILA